MAKIPLSSSICDGHLYVHLLEGEDTARVPLLLSTDSLRRMGAVIDFASDAVTSNKTGRSLPLCAMNGHIFLQLQDQKGASPSQLKIMAQAIGQTTFFSTTTAFSSDFDKLVKLLHEHHGHLPPPRLIEVIQNAPWATRLRPGWGRE
jgi:hypothetical protein